MLRTINDSSPIAPYLKPRVLLIILLGFSAGLPLALTGSTLTVWMTELKVDLTTIGIFSLVGLPYTIKFFWAPIVDAYSIPFLTPMLGKRRAWIVLSQFILILTIVFLGAQDPLHSPWLVAFGALVVATISATQDIVIDAFRVEKLPENEQAAGVAYYVTAYRIAMLVSTAGVIALVAFLEQSGVSMSAAWFWGYVAAAALVMIGLAGTLLSREPEREMLIDRVQGGGNTFSAFFVTAWEAFRDFLMKPQIVAILLFVVLFKFCDALAGTMTATFVLQIGFDKVDYAAIVKGVGLAATLVGTFAAGGIAYSLPLYTGLWLALLVQMLSNLVFVWLAWIGPEHWALVVAIVIENFTSALGTIIFIAYLSALCGNTLHTATQYAVLTALASFGRTTLAASSGYIAEHAGWSLFFIITTLVALPALLLLPYLKLHRHFDGLQLRSKGPMEVAG